MNSNRRYLAPAVQALGLTVIARAELVIEVRRIHYDRLRYDVLKDRRGAMGRTTYVRGCTEDAEPGRGDDTSRFLITTAAKFRSKLGLPAHRG